MPRAHRARQDSSREAHFTWQPEDIHITYPTVGVAESGLSDELHTVLWSLEHVSNQASLDEVMLNVAHYLTEHPGDPLVTEALTRVHNRLEHAT